MLLRTLQLSIAVMMAGVRLCAAADIDRECSQEGTIVSEASREKSSLKIVNQSQAEAEIYWLDFAGRRKLYRTVGPGENFDQATFHKHAWLIADSEHKCHKIIVMPFGTVNFTIYAGPGPD